MKPRPLAVRGVPVPQDIRMGFERYSSRPPGCNFVEVSHHHGRRVFILADRLDKHDQTGLAVPTALKVKGSIDLEALSRSNVGRRLDQSKSRSDIIHPISERKTRPRNGRIANPIAISDVKSLQVACLRSALRIRNSGILRDMLYPRCFVAGWHC